MRLLLLVAWAISWLIVYDQKSCESIKKESRCAHSRRGKSELKKINEWMNERVSEWTNRKVPESIIKLSKVADSYGCVCRFVCWTTHTHSACSHQSAIHIWQVDSAAAFFYFYLFTSHSILTFLLFLFLFRWVYFYSDLVCMSSYVWKSCRHLTEHSLTLSQNVFSERECVCVMGVIVSCVSLFFCC